MILRVDLQRLAQLRLEEAEALFSAGKYDGCVYLCGYVLETSLKACICKTLALQEYPDSESGLFKTHNFDLLELLAGLRLPNKQKRDASIDFAANWALVTRWKPEGRYVVNQVSAADASDMLEALRSKPEGVLTWLSQQW